MNKKVDLKDIIQIGVITNSTEESNKVLETVLGWKHWGIWETTPGTGRYYYDAEEDFSCRICKYVQCDSSCRRVFCRVPGKSRG